MFSQTQTLLLFIAPITKYRAIGMLQRLLLSVSSTNNNESLAATRLLSTLNDSDISSMLLNAVYKFSRLSFTEESYANMAPIQDILDALKPYSNVVRNSIDEAKDFLPTSTVDILLDYTNDGSPIDTLSAAIFMILAANLQDA